MIEHGFIKTANQPGRTQIRFWPYPDKPSRNEQVLTTFAEKYKFNYDDVDKKKLLKLFNL